LLAEMHARKWLRCYLYKKTQLQHLLLAWLDGADILTRTSSDIRLGEQRRQDTTLQEIVDMPAWKQLTRATDASLATCDIAFVNLACADGLPGAPSLTDIRDCLRKLDEWASFVRRYTALSHEQFYRKNPAQYGHSKAFFHALCLVTALQRHCGLRYNAAKIPEDVQLETADSFIHGAILGEGGTCATIPVVLAAVGRRLGYPIKLVSTRTAQWGHLFARWDDPGGERLNLEATATGLGTPDDEHYRTGMYALTPEMERAGRFLKSMTPREELANFLTQRGWRWRDQGRWRFAVESFAYASGLVPENASYLNTCKGAMNFWLDEIQKRKPPGFPALFIQAHRLLPPGVRGPDRLPHERHYPPGLPLEMEQELFAREALEDILRHAEFNRAFWEPMRRGVSLPRKPVRVLARLMPEGWNVSMEFV
jgi:hypothetical protein